MKILKLLFVLLLLYSCKEKSNQVTINGHVWNKAENTHFAGAKIVLQEYDNAIEANSKIVSSAYADDQGNFSFNFSAKKSKSYSVFIDADYTEIIVSGIMGYNELKESFFFLGSTPPSQIELSAASPSYSKLILIHDLGADSMFYERYHQFINNYTSKMFYGEELNSYESKKASGNWIYKTTTYNNGNAVISIDTLKHEINQHHVMEIHY